ncbi:polysialyltransferase family glycosyltransferase [Microbacterium sp. ZW T5_45]|uniref:polysialyltransferase family glycosyltransferase n=1 Tax=Microbacterium sp. ZW T5_45 TaxID=3378080 RepID=UPI003854181C
MTQLFAVHSVYGLATLAAAIDGGLILDQGERILVPFNSARVPETTRGIVDDPALESLRNRFDRVEDLGALLGAAHPSAWKPRESELPMLERLLARAWDIDTRELELFVQSPQVAPAKTLMALFPGARITIVGDGLMTYSPMRIDLPYPVAARIVRVVYADVVPGVRPLVGSPRAETAPVPPELFAPALAETAEPERIDNAASPTVLVLGQYLSALGLVTPAEELAMQLEMIDRAAGRAPGRIVFKPHPAAPPTVTHSLKDRASAHGIAFEEYRGPLPAELLAEHLDARAVVAGFSTALPTVSTLFGRDIASVGNREVLARLSPFENSNRIPATIVDALTRTDSPYADAARLQLLIDAVGYAMQPKIAAHLRPRAERFLRGLDANERDRYFAPHRLAELRLPGAPADGPLARMLRPAGGVGRAEEWRLTALGAKRRAGRAWRALRGR